MTPRGGLDPRAILASLGVPDVTATEPVSGGQDTAIWRVEHDGMLSALRVFRAEQAGGSQREIAAMRAAGAAGVPVPTVRIEGMWEGRPTVVLEWCAGRTLLAALGAQPWRVWSFGTMFGQMQARIHQVAAPDTLQHRSDAWLDWAGPIDTRLRERLRAVASRTDALLHFDYHPLNILTDDRQVTAVLDWPNACAGDPRADLARTEVILRFHPGVTINPLESLGVRIFLRAWWRGYQQVAGPVREMAPFYALAGMQTVQDLASKVGMPGRPFSDADLDPLRRWTAQWRHRAGLSPS